MDVTYDTTVVAESYRDALNKATAQAEAFYGNAPFELDRARADRLAPQTVLLMGPPPGPVHEVEFRFTGDPLAHAPTEDLDAEPVGPEGECPATDQPCRELCGSTCMYSDFSFPREG